MKLPIFFKTQISYAILTQLPLILICAAILYFKADIAIEIAKLFKINILFYIDLLIFILALIGVYNLLITISYHYNLDNEELMTESGVFSKNIDFLELYRIKDIAVKKPFLLRLLGLYTMTLYTSDKTHPIIKLKGINQTDLGPLMRKLVEQNRKNKNVYEID